MANPRVLVIGGGFAGYTAARTAARRLGDRAEVVLINPTDYFLYLPLLPEVAAGILGPRRITVSIPATLPTVKLVLGEVGSIDFDAKVVSWTDPEGERGELGYDRLVIAPGSVNKLLPIPGVSEHAHGFRGIPEALYLRDHITRQIELAAVADDPSERAARCTFVVVGAGYTGTEVAAQGPLFTDALIRGHANLRDQPVRWLLLDVAERVLPTLDDRLSRTADRVLRKRGIEVRTGQSVEEATHAGVRLDTGEEVPTRSLIWCVGVRPDPLVDMVGLSTDQGRVVVDEFLAVPGRPEVLACGDSAAVPDHYNPGQSTAMTAQHAVRQGRRAGNNVAASFGRGRRRPYRHRDLGFIVDLGGWDAAANPLGISLSGVPAKIVTRTYHLTSMPGNRIRTAVDWALNALLPRQAVQLGLIRSGAVPLDSSSPELPARSTRSTRT